MFCVNSAATAWAAPFMSRPAYRITSSRAANSASPEGLVITIEPIIAVGSGTGELQPDRWTVRTADRSLSAHYEHTIVVTQGAPILLTAAG